MSEIIRTCPHCKQEVKMQRGLNSENMKRLLRKPSIEDWITLFIITMVILSAYAYSYDTKTCKETLDNLDSICSSYQSAIVNTSENTSPIENITIVWKSLKD